MYDVVREKLTFAILFPDKFLVVVVIIIIIVVVVVVVVVVIFVVAVVVCTLGCIVRTQAKQFKIKARVTISPEL